MGVLTNAFVCRLLRLSRPDKWCSNQPSNHQRALGGHQAYIMLTPVHSSTRVRLNATWIAYMNKLEI